MTAKLSEERTKGHSPLATIFILCGIGSVHESAGNDEMALTCYLDAQRTALARLSHDDADMAVTFSHPDLCVITLVDFQLQCDALPLFLFDYIFWEGTSRYGGIAQLVGCSLVYDGARLYGRGHV